METGKIDSTKNTRESEVVLRKPRVLIVEDEESIDRLLHLYLEEDVQFEEGSYNSAQQAIEMLEQKKPEDPKIDLLITDLGLTDGRDAGTRVVKVFKEKYPKSSIFFLTGSPYRLDDLYTPEQKRQLGFEVLGKPLDSSDLELKVNAVKTSINNNPQS